MVLFHIAYNSVFDEYITNFQNHPYEEKNNYEVIISLTDVFTLGPLRESFMSLLNMDKFWVNLQQKFCIRPIMKSSYEAHLSLFLVSKFLSMPSIKFSNHCAIAACLSGGWLLMMFSLI